MIRLTAALFWLATQATSSGTIRIALTDASTGQPVPGAIVSLVDASRSGVTDARGGLVFTNVPPGPHHLAIRRPGYVPRVLHAFVDEAALDLTIVLTRLPTPLSTVRVETPARLPMRDDDTGDSIHIGDRSLTLAAIRNHPLLSEPDALLAVAGGHVSARPESPGGLHVFGGASDHLAYLVDGIPVHSPYHAGGTFGALNPDALSRVVLQTSVLSSTLVDALGGVLSARTRTAPDRVQAAGGLSATQARLTLELPLARSASGSDNRNGSGAGLLVSGRLLFPGLLGQKREPAHIDGDGSDALVRLAAPVAGGTLRLLALDARSDLAVASRVPDADSSVNPPRNDLQWSSTSVGAHWEQSGVSGRAQLAVWRAAGSADVAWIGDSIPLQLSSGLVDLGLLALISRENRGGEWTLSIRVHRRSSDYAVTGDTVLELKSKSTAAVVQSAWRRRFARHEFSLGSVAALHSARVHGGPFAEWTWRPLDPLTLSASAGRRFQFTQSLRNTESAVGNVFHTDLSVASGPRVPIARSDQVMAIAEWRPAPARAVAVRAWTRRLSNLILPAISTGEAFASTVIPTGDGRAQGLSFDASLSGARWGIVANYALQHVRFTALDTTWQPEHGTSQVIDAGVVFFPQPSASLRFGLGAGTGRRVTGFAGAFEWEACNLRDRGCEFAGGPFRRDGALGAIALPRYARVDVGVQKHWHLRLGSRDVQVAAHATWSNLFDTRNVLTYVRDPGTGERQVISMRPSSPLVIGLGWSY